MTIDRDPEKAPQRADLTFLRRRHIRPAPVLDPSPPAKIKYQRTAPPPVIDPPPPAKIKYQRTAPPPVSPVPPIERTAPAPTPPPAPPSLDLSAPPPSGGPPKPVENSAPLPKLPPPPRVRTGTVVKLENANPTVSLTRLQSGTGALDIGLVADPTSGDLSLGCAYQFTNGDQGLTQVTGEQFGAAPDPRHPALWLSQRTAGQGATLDLRLIRTLRRLIFFAYSPSSVALEWRGLVSLQTFGGARVEVPVDHAPFAGTLVLMTIFVVNGEMVLRREMEPFPGRLDAALRGFGYDITTL